MSETMVATPVVKTEPEPTVVKLPGAPERFSVRESSFAYPEVDVTMPIGHTVEDALRAEYWANHAHKMKRPTFSAGPDWSGTILHLRSDDHAFYAKLYVRAVKQASLIVSQIGDVTYFGPKEVKSKGYESRWNVGKQGWNIIRKSDREIVGFGKTKEEVQLWIDEAMKVH